MPRKAKSKAKAAKAVKQQVPAGDLGVLQSKLEALAGEEKSLQAKLQGIEKQRARLQRQVASVLRKLGIGGVVSASGEAPAKKGAKRGPGRRGQRASGPRYTLEERAAAVKYVEDQVRSGKSIAAAILGYNTQVKPKGKTNLNYQTYHRWRA